MSNIETAVAQFAEAWKDLAGELVGGYECYMTCSEADTMAELFRLAGDVETADWLVKTHMDAEEEPETCIHHTPDA